MDVLDAWRNIPKLVDEAVAGGDLDVRSDDDGMTLHEVVHHIAEANVVAAGIIVAALGSPGCTYDWSWMMPFGPWMTRMAYDRKPIDPALRLLHALNIWVVAQIEPLADGLTREIYLRDEPEGALRKVTVADVLQQEIDHARGHLPSK
jgi:hypothetical protein